MSSQFTSVTVLIVFLLWVGRAPVFAQQKPQWLPGQIGLNAGILPSPGFTYVNITTNYDANTYNDFRGKAIPATGSYNVWAVENIFFWVPNAKIAGGNVAAMVMYPTPATGSLVLDIANIQRPNLSVAAGGGGVADLWLQPFNIGWHLKRADLQVANAFMIPTGRYSPGATNNVGSGYFGNHVQTGSTFYITKNKGTSANLFTDWEVHGSRPGVNNTSKTPGQAFTDEWGFGQALPLNKKMTKLFQVGAVGYNQWQITDNGGSFVLAGVTLPARILPHYSVQAVGGQLNYIDLAKNLVLTFKYENEIAATSHTLGRTIVFGGVWTLQIPKPKPQPSK